jgi:hypothetical protein
MTGVVRSNHPALGERDPAQVHFAAHFVTDFRLVVWLILVC